VSGLAGTTTPPDDPALAQARQRARRQPHPAPVADHTQCRPGRAGDLLAHATAAVAGRSAGGGARVHRTWHEPLGAGPPAAPTRPLAPADPVGPCALAQALQGLR